MIRYDGGYWDDAKRVSQNIPDLKNIYNKNVLITGATGMICSTVVDLLFYLNRKHSAGIGIILAGRSEQRISERFSGFECGADYSFVPYDATREMDVGVEADFIIHGASNANPAIYTKEPVETMLANFIGLNSLLKMAADTGCGRLLYISSSEVYGNKEESRPYKEEDYGFVDILNPRAAYPSAKRAAETLCAAYGLEYGLDTVIVRPGHIYGPSITDADSRASAQFTRNAAGGQDIVMKSAGTQLRSYCYTFDCASAILTVLLGGKKGEAYNISNRDSVVTISEMARALAKAAGVDVVYEEPTDLEKKGYNLMENSSLDAKRLEALGWSATFGLREGAERTMAFYAMGANG